MQGLSIFAALLHSPTQDNDTAKILPSERVLPLFVDRMPCFIQKKP